MACIITYENKQYTQKEFEQYFKEHFTEFVDNFLGSKQDIERFKKFIEGNSLLTEDLKQDLIKKHGSDAIEVFNSLTEEEQMAIIKCL